MLDRIDSVALRARLDRARLFAGDPLGDAPAARYRVPQIWGSSTGCRVVSAGRGPGAALDGRLVPVHYQR
ncbi:hypothetical protein D7193_12625 [Micromonospora costi]|uniref:Uncharacterized protein n=1 Tax=Micromonospora costi TaxID=1530042 RepID=A0A3B0A4X0_9ACTN|nr:hypothetical protein D7193_12625 [Micromonospora costi]